MSAVKYILICLLCISLSSAKAQDSSTLIGIKLIPSLAMTYPDYGVEAARFGFSGGLQYVKQLDNTLSFETGLYLLDRGSEIDVSILDVSGVVLRVDTITTRYLFLSIPITLRAALQQAYFMAGPSLDIFVYGYEYNQDLDIKNNIGDEEDEVRRINAGLLVALGYQQDITGRWNIFVEARADGTLNNVDKVNPLRFVNVGLVVGVNYDW